VKNKKLSVMMAVLVALVCWFSPQSAMAVLDQSQENLGDSEILVYDNRSLAQTFTAGISGELSGVDVYFESVSSEAFGPVTFGIYTTSSGIPDGSALWTSTFTPTATGWHSVDTSSGAPVLVASGTYAIVLTSTDSSFSAPNTRWAVDRSGNLYSGGSFMEKRIAESWTPLTVITSGTAPTSTDYPLADAAFRTNIVPEPGTFIMLAIGTGFVFLFRRRRYAG